MVTKNKTRKELNILGTVTLMSFEDFSDLHSWWVEAHVVDPPTGLMDPAGAQSLLQSLEGDVEADDHVHLAQIVHGVGLRQSAGET